MSRVVRVPLSDSPYDVLIGPALLGQAGKAAAGVVAPGRCAVVTDTNVGPLYAERLTRSLESAGFEPTVVTVAAGEASKSMSRVEEICDAMIASRLDRNASLFALGGGVVGDLAGFVAAIYFRGIPFVQVPTSVVAQVDSSVGGKTGVNATRGKNLIGSFHQPRLVIADVETLQTLPERERNEGFAEIIKHAAIRDPEMLGRWDDLAVLVERNVAIKAEIVAADEFETRGLRALLNFGHTIGHGIENAGGYGRFLHGEAISLGLVAACRLSVEKAGLPPSDAARVIAALEEFGLPTRLPADVSTEAVLAAMATDKKFRAGAIRFVLLRALGDAFVSPDVTLGEIRDAIEGLR